MIKYFRILRIPVATLVAIYLATFIGLNNALTAGIITILTLYDTRQASKEISLTYLSAAFIAFIIATIIFSLFGFKIWAFGIYLLIFIPLAYYLNLSAAIAPISVLVTHFINAESVSFSWQINGLLLLIIGVGIAMLFNVWVPALQDRLNESILAVENAFKELLLQISKQLVADKLEISLLKTNINAVENEINNLREIAYRDFDNQVFDQNDYYIKYVEMRSNQLTQLKHMVDSLQYIHSNTSQAKKLMHLFETTSKEFDQQNSGLELLQSISDLYKIYRNQTLPLTRVEFENRAILYHLLLDFERFLEIKRDFFIKYSAPNNH